MSKTELVMEIRADLRQIALEERLGQVECDGSHDALVTACVYCGGAL